MYKGHASFVKMYIVHIYDENCNYNTEQQTHALSFSKQTSPLENLGQKGHVIKVLITLGERITPKSFMVFRFYEKILGSESA